MNKQLRSVIGVVLGVAIGGAMGRYVFFDRHEPTKVAQQNPAVTSPVKPQVQQAVPQAAQEPQQQPEIQVPASAMATLSALAPDDSKCFKEAFRKTVAGVTWHVRACENPPSYGEKGGMMYKVDYREGSAEPRQSTIEYRGDISWLTDGDYRVISPKTLLIGMPSERGGIAYLLHQSKHFGGFSEDKIHYMSNDEDGLSVNESNNSIYLKSAYNDIVYTIDKDGDLHKIKDHGGTMTCEKSIDKAEGGGDDYKLVVERADGEILSVKYFGSDSNGEEGGASFCDFEASQELTGATLKQQADRTTVSWDEGDGEHKSKIIIDQHQSDDTFTASFDVWHGNCGPHSEFPKKMVLHADHTCEVKTGN